MGLPVTVGIVTVAHGDRYQRFLPEWSTAVAGLHRQPDQITIITDRLDPDIKATIDETLGEWIHLETERTFQHHPQVLVNDAIRFTPTEWVCKMDADDLIRPDAFDDIDMIEADVLVWGIHLAGRDLHAQNITREHVLEAYFNVVFSGSPFRRWVWEAAPYRDMIYEDWAFWIEAAKHGARFQPTSRIGYEYRQHGANISEHCDDQYWTNIVRGLK